MNITELSIRRPVTTIMLFVSMVAIGLIASFRLPLEAEPEDENHRFAIESVENEHFISVSHPMSKEHYLSFIAWVTGDRLTLVKWYPEGNAETRIQLRGHGILYTYCNHHGLFMRRI